MEQINVYDFELELKEAINHVYTNPKEFSKYSVEELYQIIRKYPFSPTTNEIDEYKNLVNEINQNPNLAHFDGTWYWVGNESKDGAKVRIDLNIKISKESIRQLALLFYSHKLNGRLKFGFDSLRKSDSVVIYLFEQPDNETLEFIK